MHGCKNTNLLISSLNNAKKCNRCVTELKAVIHGPSDLYVKSGSEITLNCKLQQGPHDLGTIYWYKGEFTNIFSRPTAS